MSCELKLSKKHPDLLLTASLVDVDGNESVSPTQTFKASIYKVSTARYFNFVTNLFDLSSEPVLLQDIPHIEHGVHEKILPGAIPADEDTNYRVHVVLTDVGSGINRDFTEPVSFAISDVSSADVSAIKAKTDNLPSDPASETNATANKVAIIAEVNENEVKINTIVTAVTGVIQADIVKIQGNSTIDGDTIIKHHKLLSSMMNGRFKLNYPTPGLVTFFERDNVTEITTCKITSLERTRIS